MKLHLKLSLILLFGAGCQTSLSASVPTHMLRLACEGVSEAETRSRLAVLAVGDPFYDFGFATGHAIPPERPCTVKDFEGRQRSVNFIRLADGYKVGENTDWAILRFDKITTKKLVRYRLKAIEDLGPLDAHVFSFAQARGLPENAQSCRLKVLDFNNGRNRVTHDCRAVPGQSGSPITFNSDGQQTLVGLHIGHLWMLEAPDTGRPDRRGYINLLDDKIILQIQTIIKQNRS